MPDPAGAADFWWQPVAANPIRTKQPKPRMHFNTVFLTRSILCSGRVRARTPVGTGLIALRGCETALLTAMAVAAEKAGPGARDLPTEEWLYSVILSDAWDRLIDALRMKLDLAQAARKFGLKRGFWRELCSPRRKNARRLGRCGGDRGAAAFDMALVSW
jgi:hypothetical protein